MATTKLGLPTITGNMAADVVRDLNALADAVDEKAGTAGGLATLGSDGKVPSGQLNVDTSNLATKTEVSTLNQTVTTHLAESMPHRFLDTTDNKTYRYGLKTNATKDGLIFVYEEVV